MIFNKRCLPIYKASMELTLKKHDICFCKFLTTEIVEYSIAKKKKLILSENGSVGCHGSVYLRAHNFLITEPIYCYSLFQFTNIKTIITQIISVTIYFDQVILNLNKTNKGFNLINKNLTISKFSLQDINQKPICFWKNRQLSVLEFSIRKIGLEKSLSSLGFRNVSCSQNSNGNILIQNSPSLLEILTIAHSPNNSHTSRMKLIKDYDFILKKLQELDSDRYNLNKIKLMKQIERLIELSEIYYSNFFLYHDTYDSIFFKARHIGKCLGFTVEDTQDLILQCCSVTEYVQKMEFPEVRKGFIYKRDITSLPKMLLFEEISREKKRFAKALFSINLGDNVQTKKYAVEYLSYAIEVLCIKERKFILNKTIYSRLTKKILELFSLKSMKLTDVQFNTQFSNMTISELMEIHLNAN